MEFWEIDDEHYSRVGKVILALVRDEWAADDLTQETFIRVQDHLAELQDPTKHSSWMCHIVYNLCQDRFRANDKLLNKNSEGEERKITGEESAEKQFEQFHVGASVQDEIDRLPESFREVIILADLKDFS